MKDSKFTDREEHEKMTKIENLTWEIAKILKPNTYINPNTVKKAKDIVITILEAEK